MAIKKYLGVEGLNEIAGKVNQKLRIVTTMPASSTNNDIVIYNGATTELYVQGGIYVYDATLQEWKLQQTSTTGYSPSFSNNSLVFGNSGSTPEIQGNSIIFDI